MSREDSFLIGMALHSIAMTVTDKTLNDIQPYIAEIEEIVAKNVAKEDDLK